MNEIQKKIIKDNGLIEVKEKTRYNDDDILIYQKYRDGSERILKYTTKGRIEHRKYPDGREHMVECNNYQSISIYDGKLIYEKYPDGRYYIDGKYYEKKK